MSESDGGKNGNGRGVVLWLGKTILPGLILAGIGGWVQYLEYRVEVRKIPVLEAHVARLQSEMDKREHMSKSLESLGNKVDSLVKDIALLRGEQIQLLAQAQRLLDGRGR